MKLSLFVAASALALGLPAQAATVFSDNFDGGPAPYALNYAGFANFDVVGGTVDYLNPYPGLNCASGGCVDLDGSTSDGGRLVTKLSYAFNAGDIVSLSFDISGSQRGSAEDVNYGFLGDSSIDYNNVVVAGPPGGPFNFGNISSANLGITTFGLASNFGFTTFNVTFTAGNAGSIKAYVGSPSADSVGVIVDNFALAITPGAVPEPATWGMMIGGFALAGAAMRRRKAIVRFA